MTDTRSVEQLYEEARALLRAHGIELDAPHQELVPNQTAVPPESPEDAPKPEPVIVTAQPGSRLAWLYDRYDEIKPELDKLKTQLDEVNDGIKAETCRLSGNAPRARIRRPGETVGLALTYSTPNSFNSKGFRASSPANNATYLQWSTQSSKWDLRREK
jgi:hypothetical protein